MIEADRVSDLVEKEIEVIDLEIAVIADLPGLLRIEADEGLPDRLDRPGSATESPPPWRADGLSALAATLRSGTSLGLS